MIITGGIKHEKFTAAVTATRMKAHALHILLLAGLIAGFVASAHANDEGVQRAARFLGTDVRAKATLNYVHFGTDYRGQKYLKRIGVVDASGNPIQGDFALVYRLFWNDDGVTDIAYLCNGNGRVYSVQIMYTNAEGNVPFLWAKVSIQILGNLLIDAYKDKLTDDDRRQLQKLVNDADAKSMLEWSLKLDQLFSSD